MILIARQRQCEEISSVSARESEFWYLFITSSQRCILFSAKDKKLLVPKCSWTLEIKRFSGVNAYATWAPRYTWFAKDLISCFVWLAYFSCLAWLSLFFLSLSLKESMKMSPGRKQPRLFRVFQLTWKLQISSSRLCQRSSIRTAVWFCATVVNVQVWVVDIHVVDLSNQVLFWSRSFCVHVPSPKQYRGPNVLCKVFGIRCWSLKKHTSCIHGQGPRQLLQLHELASAWLVSCWTLVSTSLQQEGDPCDPTSQHKGCHLNKMLQPAGDGDDF